MARQIAQLSIAQSERAHAEGFAIETNAGGLVPHGSIFWDATAVREHLRARAMYGDSFACAVLIAATPYGAPAAIPSKYPDNGGRVYGVALGVSERRNRLILYIPGVGLRHCSPHEIESAHAWEVAARAGWEAHAAGQAVFADYGHGESFQCLPGAYASERDALGAAFERVQGEAIRAYARTYGETGRGESVNPLLTNRA